MQEEFLADVFSSVSHAGRMCLAEVLSRISHAGSGGAFKDTVSHAGRCV